MTPVRTTFLFADIAGFTALTEAHGDEHAAGLVADFCDAVDTELPAVNGTRVNTIGDAVMLTVDDPAGAIGLALRISRADARARRAGRACRGAPWGCGRARGRLLRSGGEPRPAGICEAAGGEGLVTGKTASLAPQVRGVLYEPRGRRALRYVREPVELFAAIRLGESRARTRLRSGLPDGGRPRPRRGQLMYEGTALFFCTLACAGHFASDPERYTH